MAETSSSPPAQAIGRWRVDLAVPKRLIHMGSPGPIASVPVTQGVMMYQHRPQPSVLSRLFGSARTLTAILLTALLASALTVRWSDAMATNAPVAPTATSQQSSEVPVAISGSVVGASEGHVALVEQGSDSAVAFPVAETASLTRGGQPVTLDALRVGDSVQLTVDASTGQILHLEAVPAAVSAPIYVPGAVALLAAVGLIAGAAALAIVNTQRLPALPARFQSTRLMPEAAAAR